MARFALALGLSLAAPAAAFVAPPRGDPAGIAQRKALGVVEQASRASSGRAEDRAAQGRPSGSAFGVLGAGLGLGLLLQRFRQSRVGLWAAIQKGKTSARDATIRRLTPVGQGSDVHMIIHKSYNNTHVCLAQRGEKIIWHTTEKRYGATLPNTNFAIEAAVYTAGKLGIPRLFVQLMGPNSTAMQSAIMTIRNLGIEVSGCVIRNNIRYGGNRDFRACWKHLAEGLSASTEENVALSDTQLCQDSQGNKWRYHHYDLAKKGDGSGPAKPFAYFQVRTQQAASRIRNMEKEESQSRASQTLERWRADVCEQESRVQRLVDEMQEADTECRELAAQAHRQVSGNTSSPPEGAGAPKARVFLRALVEPEDVASALDDDQNGLAQRKQDLETLFKKVGRTIKLKIVERKVRVLEKPEPLPDMQTGCAPAPSTHGQVISFRSQAAANQEWAMYTLKLEKEAFAIRGMRWAENDPQAGRAEEPAWRIKPLSFGGDNLPTATRRAFWWRRISRSLRNLQGARRRLRAATEQRDMRSREAKEQERLFRARGQRTQHLTTEEQGARQARRELLAAGRRRGSAEKGELQGLYEGAAAESKECDRQPLKERRAKWADNLDAAAAGATGGSRRLSRPAQVWGPGRAGAMDVSACSLEAAEFALSERRGARRTGDPMQQQIKPRGVEAREQLGDSTEEGVAKLKRVAGAFRKKTDVGVYGGRPSPLQGVSDGARATLPGILREATTAATVGVVKAFERVGLFALREAGKQLKFSAKVLAVARPYFVMARRHIVGEPMSEETRGAAAVIAGGKFSPGYLKMAIQSTVDGLAVERPIVKWRMRVGDLREFGETLDACFEGFDKRGPDSS
ncbi:unnamed protein product [Prorocentrum cordatum]|uniref:Uncharacterized protein n=1 Tax=Prorocentrum cordatum TaxID=2364126 RepID=A0ABN9SNX1_9DINO|nr:unnamed protein product [Polarella glacialis]